MAYWLTLHFLVVIFSLISKKQNAQFDGAVGSFGCKAIYKDSVIFIDWASACNITRGLQDTANPNLGYTTVGNDSSAIGMAG